MKKISVCLATYNGENFIEQQINSILSQLSDHDELIISDDNSLDNTCNIIKDIDDTRIILIKNRHTHSPINNFENALNHAKGDLIFLSDQDDIWLPNKVNIMSHHLSKYNVVTSNCFIVDKELNIIADSFFQKGNMRNGFWRNLYDNHYLGCCMAFQREILDIILPFPQKIAMHDIWIGLCSEVFFSSTFINDKLILYRRHGKNASKTSEKSNASLRYKLCSRIYFLIEITKRYYNVRKSDVFLRNIKDL